MTVRAMLIGVVGLLIAGCAAKHVDRAEKDWPPKRPAISIDEATRLVKAKAIRVTPLPYLRGWYEVVFETPNGMRGIVYVDEEKKHLITGAIFDAVTGENLTALRARELGLIKEMVPRPRPALRSENVERIKKETVVFHFGKKSKKVEPLVVFVDPRCPFCHRAWPTIMKAANQVPVDVIVVGFLGPESVRVAALLYDTKDPKELDRVMMGRGVPAGTPSSEMVDKVRKTTDAVAAAGVSGVPTFYRHGRVISGFAGESAVFSLLGEDVQ